MRTYNYILAISIFIILFSCKKAEKILPKESYNEKANQLIEQIMNQNSCGCILEIPKESMIRVRQKEQPLRYKNIKQELITKLGLKNEVELENLEMLSNNFTLDRNFISQKKIQIIDIDTFRNKGVLELSKNCPRGRICSLNKPIFDKNYKTAVIYFNFVYSCTSEITVYKEVNGKWIEK
ncbi:hypothetical protein QWY90_03260 [Flavobacterium paronense]|uniref:Lipoprotein n=1 Tax=Flavobacterium paronense TaxID=1392775 RepID=A0ABV5GFW1_9FLAO|nr:hypothetical protein [Flavobacterium paronense]MDN3676326.1 hypothetical protein [Flavobacterium paronense]